MFERRSDMKIQQLSQENAVDIANNWRYDGIYAFYNADADKEDYEELVTPELRMNSYFEVLENKTLIGFFTVDYDYDKKTVDLGLGMKPSLTSKGQGEKFVEEIVNYIKEFYTCKIVTLAVVTFNERAIKVYERVGFEKKDKFKMNTNGEMHEFLFMEKLA